MVTVKCAVELALARVKLSRKSASAKWFANAMSAKKRTA
jgi:hypothetical protein